MPLPQPSPYLPDPMYVTLEDVRSSVTSAFLEGDQEGLDLSVAGPYNDQQVTNMIIQASRKIDGHIKDTLVLAVRFEETRGTDSANLRLRHYPVWQGSITSLTSPATAGDTTIQVADMLGMQPGKDVFFLSRESMAPVIHPTFVPNPLGGPGPVTLYKPLLQSHYSGEQININGVDLVQIQLPNSVYPITTDTIIVEYALGLIQNYTPLIFQRTGYTPIFMKNVPIQIQYTSGLLPTQYPPALKQACLDLLIYQALGRRYTGIKRYHTGVRSVEYENALAKGIPPDVVDALSQFQRTEGFI